MQDSPIFNAPSLAPSPFPLLSEIDAATVPVTKDEERRSYSASHGGSQDLPFCWLLVAPSQSGSKLPSQTTAHFLMFGQEKAMITGEGRDARFSGRLVLIMTLPEP